MSFLDQKIPKTLILYFIISLFLLISPIAAESADTHEVGIVNVNRLKMRIEPKPDAHAFRALDKGAQVRVLAHQKGWLQVFYDGDIGYITDQSDYIKLYSIHTVTDTRVSDLEKAKEKVKDFLRRIEKNRSEIDTVTKNEDEVVEQLHQTDLALNDAKRQSAAISVELAKVKDEMAKTQEQADDIEKAIDKGKTYAVKRLVALYKLNKLGEMNLFASATSVNDFEKSKAAVEKILQSDQEVIGGLVDKKQELSDLLSQLNEKKMQKAELERKYKESAGKLAREKNNREKILADLKSQKADRQASLKYLQEAAETLDRTITELSKEPSYENNVQTETGIAKETGKGAFSASQGLLKWPVQGKVISRYGKYIESESGATNFRNGIEIQAKEGSPVHAVFGGQIAYADWLKGYGNVIIIAHGDNYYTVYAHAEELFRSKGDKVEAGDVIGTVGDTGSISGPSLYFELRHHGSPEDPLKWIEKG